MSFPVPFGRFQLLSRIAVGGMAEVYLARSFGVEGFEKRLVIKKILTGLSTQARYVDLFVQEAKVCAALSHPNIVQVFELGKVGEEHFISMEHIHGRDLTRVLRVLRTRSERLPMAVAVAITAFVCRALAYAHSRTTSEGRPMRIVHRDVSPHNVILSFEGEVKLLDFGIARPMTDLEEGVRGAGGKQAYMSPEQARGESIAEASDVYSLGLVLYELLTNKRIFTSDEDGELDRSFVPDVRSYNPDIPAVLAEIVEQVLQVDPTARPTAAELESRLRAFLFEVGFHSATPAISAVMRRLFADDLAADPAKADLARLAQDLDDMHTGLEPEPTASIQETGTEGRSPRLFAETRGERRTVVVLVAEVSGLTEVSARAETEEIAKLHYRMLRVVRRLVDRMTGTPTEYEDDTLTVLFGLTRAHGDDVERALSCARELHRLSLRLRRKGLPVEFSVGVHVGEVTVGRKQGARYRFAPRGDTLKTGVRLAYAADPGATLVSDRVVALVGDRFPFDRGPELRRKGGRASRPSFRLTGGRRAGARTAQGRWYRRGAELEMLRDTIAGLSEGQGARILIRGEAGIGKSQFFREIRELALRREIPTYFGRALPFGNERPFAPFRDLVSDILGIRGDHSPDNLREKLGRLTELGLEAAEISTIGTLYGVELMERREPSRDAMFAAAARLIRGLCADGPAIVLMEDIQYLEGVEKALFEQMLRAAETEPMLMLLSARDPVDLGRRVQDRVMGPLNAEQAVAFAAEILGAEGCGPDLSRLLRRTAEGNPLYISEIIKALHRAERIWFEGRVARLKDPQVDPGLPPTLHGLVTERIDCLEYMDKVALQVASIIGSTFSRRLLAASLGLADPDRLMEGLLKAGLVLPDPTDPEQGSFASILIWECVVRAIPGPLRREYHRMVASGMEHLYGDQLHNVVEAWATHCHAGGRLKDAAKALCTAAEQLRETQFLDRSLERFQKALLWIEQLPRDQVDSRLETRLNLGAGEVGMLIGHPRAERFLQVALDIAGEEGPEEYEARAMLALGLLNVARGKDTLARSWIDAALSIFRKRGDAAGQVQALEVMGTLALQKGQVEAAERLYQEGLLVAGQDRSLAARMLLGLATQALQRAALRTAEDLLRQALPLAEGDRILMGRILNNLGILHYQEQRYLEALEQFGKALELRQGLGYRWGEVVNHHNIGDAWLATGNHANAYAAFEQSRDLAKEVAWERGVVMNEVFLWYLRGLRGEPVLPELERLNGLAKRLGDRETAIVASFLSADIKQSRDLLLLARNEAEQAGFAALASRIDRRIAALGSPSTV